MDPNQPSGPPPAQNQPETTPKQQAVDRLRQAANVLVTVKTNPTVDQLAATIGMTLMLNKLGKHATAVFSGEVPSTLEFLKPEETIEANTDSLRDFIVSLDKSKADKLRYKVEENVVRIYITPYKSSLSESDLEFSQGDFNVDAVVALGVTQREELDQAIISHGRILHDATVISVIAGQAASELGQINWQEAGASSLSEMLVSISEAFQGGLIDEQIATAFLTGIVAETERFSNIKTTPKVMTMAAQLMAAGANQQLIANELEKAVEVDLEQPAPAEELPEPVEEPAPEVPEASATPDGSLTITHDEQPEQPAEPAPEPVPEPEPEPEPTPLPMPVFEEPVEETPPNQIEIDHEGNLTRPNVEPKHKVIQPLPPEPEQPAAPPEAPSPSPPFEPEQASSAPDEPAPAGHASVLPPPGLDLTPTAPIQDDTTLAQIEESVHSPHADGGSQQSSDVSAARNAVTDALNQAGFDPAGQSRADLNAMPLGAPPEPTSFDAFRLPDAPSDQPIDSSYEGENNGHMPPPPVPPPMTAL